MENYDLNKTRTNSRVSFTKSWSKLATKPPAGEGNAAGLFLGVEGEFDDRPHFDNIKSCEIILSALN